MGVYKKKIALVLLCAAAISFSGCTPQNAATTGQSSKQEQQNVFATITDDTGKTITLKEKPQRVVALSTSLMNFANAVDGDLAGRATVKSEDVSLPQKYANVPDVGPVYNVSTEKIVSLKPDVVFASESQHQKIVPILEQNGIPVIVLKCKTYDDVKRNLDIVGKVYGKEDVAKAKEAELDKQIDAIVSKVPQTPKKIAIIHATPSNVTVELQSSLAGDIAHILKLNNVAVDAATKDKDTEKIPYSIEALVAKNPDIIFFTSMGPKNKIENTIKNTVESNPAWSSLHAVQQGKVYVLPENYFLLNPGLDYPQAVEYMAKLAYPEVFGQ